jgi:hypothetical protein
MADLHHPIKTPPKSGSTTSSNSNPGAITMFHQHEQKSNHSKYVLSFASMPMALFAMALILFQVLIFHDGLSVLRSDNSSQQQHRSLAIETPPLGQIHLSTARAKTTTATTKHFERVDAPPADGTFNGYPVYFRQDVKEIETTSHCVGENYQEGKSWMHRSCEFSFFCFDTATKDFVVFQSPEDEKIYVHVDLNPFLDVSQSFLKQGSNKTNTVSLGGINLKWADGIHRLEWFPEIRSLRPDETLSFYELPTSVVMVPFHSMNAANPGHLVWDDFMAIWTLQTMFQLEKNTDLLMMRYILKDGVRGLWASCEWTDEKTEDCARMLRKFLPLMLGMDPVHKDMPTTEKFSFELKNGDSGNPKSNLICAKHGLAGIGALSDHGTSKLHGWEDRDYETTQNHGRGGMIYEFRNFMLRNMGYPVEFDHKPPFRIVFSERSSNIGHRNLDFAKQKEILARSFNPSYVSVESYVFSELSLTEQLDIASQTSIYITTCGGGAVTSMFMPRGSSVIMYYLEYGGVVHGKETGKPARLDWDLFNNMAYLKVHWLPVGTMGMDADVQAFLLLIQHELDSLIREKSYDHFFN